MFGTSDHGVGLLRQPLLVLLLHKKLRKGPKLQAAGRDQTYVAPAQSLLVCMQACKRGGGGKQFVWEGSGAGFSTQF